MSILDDDKILQQSDGQQPPDDGSIMGGAQTPASKSILDSTPHPLTVIPGSKPHEDGKMAYAQLIPKLTAPAGSIDWLHQRQEQLEFEKAHPYGAPISKHPGTFGTILHGLAKAGNIAGDILAPGTMANIPGTDMHRAAEQSGIQSEIEKQGQLENQGKEASAAVTRAGAEQENADTAKKNADQPKPKEEKWAITKDWVDADNSPLRMEENSGQLVRATDGKPPTGVKAAPTAKPEKPDTPEQQFMDSPEEASKPMSQRISDYSRLTQKPERPEKEPKGESFVDANGKVIEMKPGMTLPPGAKPLSKAGEPTADEQRRNDLATNLNENLNQLEGIVDRRPELFGPLAGRWSELKSKFGSDDPDIAALSVLEHQIGMAQISAHGMRSAHGIEGAAQSIINGLHSGPTALKGAIATVRKSVGTFQQDVANAKGQGESQPERPANVPEGYVHKPNGPRGSGWYKP